MVVEPVWVLTPVKVRIPFPLFRTVPAFQSGPVMTRSLTPTPRAMLKLTVSLSVLMPAEPIRLAWTALPPAVEMTRVWPVLVEG